ncbi:uncharacterized protein LOC143204659 [Rhynchophorus ferrugineus]|uniref:uncharacterized protein LOC143204659 n=1 Tax=Rhynchophorus ferrugineus TaxID=354439 RepID=UPI003FCDB347
MSNNEQLIAVTKYQMICYGYWPKPISSTPIFNTLYTLYSKFVKIGLILICILLLVEFFHLIMNDEDSRILIASFGVIISVYLFGLKIFICHRNHLLDVMDEIVEKEKEIWKSEDDDVKEMYTKQVIFCNVLCFVQLVIVSICTTALGYVVIQCKCRSDCFLSLNHIIWEAVEILHATAFILSSQSVQITRGGGELDSQRRLGNGAQGLKCSLTSIIVSLFLFFLVRTATLPGLSICGFHKNNIFVIISGITADGQIIEYNQAHNTSLDSHNWYQFWFPGSKLEHRGIVYAINIAFGTLGGGADIAWHSVLSTLMIFAVTRLQILKIKLRKFIKEDTAQNTDNKTTELKEYIVEHQYLISYVKNLNENIKSVMLMHFSLNAIEIASSLSGLIQGPVSVGQQIFLITYTFLTLYQIFMTTWNANEIREQSTGIADALYQSNWLLLNKEGKVLCQVMMNRAQKPLAITIGPFGVMTNQSILTIVKAAYSYVSIMH